MDYNNSLEDLYDFLEVNQKASKEVIDASFRALKIKYHPDNKRTGNERKLQKISEAYNVLSDHAELARYEDTHNNLNGKVIGEYRILSRIAEGGFGRTYKAEHLLTKEFACIKDCSNISPEMEEILIEEARAMWNLRHYSVPAVRNMIRLPNRSLALVMSYIPGPTLMEIIEKQNKLKVRLDPEHVAWITERVLNALRYIHYNGVLHGDLKPHNIIVEPDKHMASIVDFGFSKIRSESGDGNKGYTEFFSAPEIIAGRDAIPQSDFFSLGMTMIFALTGDVDRMRSKQIPKDTPEPMKVFISRLIVRDPLSRPIWPKKQNETDLWDEFMKVREESFGRRRSGLKEIPGFEK